MVWYQWKDRWMKWHGSILKKLNKADKLYNLKLLSKVGWGGMLLS